MLILTRTLESPTIHIGEDITLHITQIKGGQVRLALNAPADIVILRGELMANQEEPRFSESRCKKNR